MYKGVLEVSRLGRYLEAAWAITLQAIVGCSKKETLQETLIASVPNSGGMSTSFTVPNSSHVFVLIASPDSNAAIEGHVVLVANGKKISFPIGTNAVRSNWLQHRGCHRSVQTDPPQGHFKLTHPGGRRSEERRVGKEW